MSAALGRIARFISYDRSIGFGLEHIGLTALRHPRIMTVLLVLFTIFSLVQVPRINVDADLLRIFANSGEHYDNYAELSETFGTFENDVYLLVTSDRLTDPDELERLRDLAFDLELNEYAVGTLSPFSLRRPGPEGSVPAVPEFMETEPEVRAALADLQQNDPLMRNLITPDLTGFVMIMFPNTELTADGGDADMIASLRDLVADYETDGTTIELTGPPIWTAEMLGATISDQTRFTLVGFALGTLVALLTLRSFWGAVLVATTPAIAVLWSMSTITAIFGSFSFLTVIVTTLVLVICFAESMFFVVNWIAFCREGMNPRRAVDATIKLVGPATALTTLALLVSFGSLSLTEGQGVQEFSAAGAIGATLVLLAIMTFLPLSLKLAVRLGFRTPRRVSVALTGLIPLSLFISSRFARPLTVVSILVTVLLIVPYFLIQPRFEFEDFIAADSDALATAAEIDDSVGGVGPIYVRVPLAEAAQGTEMSDADFARIEAVHRLLEGELGANKVISAASFNHYTEAGFSREAVFEAVGPFLRQRFVTEDGTQALVTGFMPTVVDSGELRRIVETMEAELPRIGAENAEIGGFRVLATFATDQIVSSLQVGLVLSVGINLVLIGFAFRSLRMALVSAIPNLLPVLGTEAWLYLTGQGLQMTSVIALTIAFGLAINDTVHFLSHYLHDRREGRLGHAEAVHHSLRRIGAAIVATTLVLCAGMLVVAFAELPQVATFGVMFILTLALALVGDLFILPGLLLAGNRFFETLGSLRVRSAEGESTPDDPHAVNETVP